MKKTTFNIENLLFKIDNNKNIKEFNKYINMKYIINF